MSERQPTSWRATLAIHFACELFPPLPPDELRALGKDILKHGLKSPIALWRADPKGQALLLDGRNRLDAIELVTGATVEVGPPSIMAGKNFLATNTVIVLEKSVDPWAYVISANIQRRHLTTEQKRDLIAKLLKRDPSKSDRQIAETVKASHHNRCDRCGQEDDLGPMLRDDIWRQLAEPGEHALCGKCMIDRAVRSI